MGDLESREPDPGVSRRRSRLRLVTPGAARRLAVGLGLLLVLGAWGYLVMIRMPGRSHRGLLPPLDAAQQTLRDELQRDVRTLAGDIGARSVLRPRQLVAAADFIEAELEATGLVVSRQCFEVHDVTCCNIEAELPGSSRASEIVVIEAHYDSVVDDAVACPGANDNASGVAGTLALARRFAARRPACTVRFVFFVNEEPPFFQTDDMGSLVYARRCRAREENIVAMLTLETIGCYRDEPESQDYPPPLSLLYPSTGDFIGFVGNVASRHLVRDAIATFRKHARFPSEGAAVPGWITGVGWSDHWSFWQAGYPGVMVTDTAPFRYEHYHRSTDTPDRLDYDRMARVVDGVGAVLADMAGAGP